MEVVELSISNWIIDTVNAAAIPRQINPAHNATGRDNFSVPIAPVTPENGVCFHVGFNVISVGSKYSFRY
jgi:hypothetical protein